MLSRDGKPRLLIGSNFQGENSPDLMPDDNSNVLNPQKYFVMRSNSVVSFPKKIFDLGVGIRPWHWVTFKFTLRNLVLPVGGVMEIFKVEDKNLLIFAIENGEFVIIGKNGNQINGIDPLYIFPGNNGISLTLTIGFTDKAIVVRSQVLTNMYLDWEVAKVMSKQNSFSL